MKIIQLKPRTTYRNNRGDRVHIAGLAQSGLIDGERIFWSIQGDWYSESGRFVDIKRVPIKNPDYKSGLYDYNHYLCPPENGRSLAKEEQTEEEKEWWKGVQTERN